MAWEQHEEVTEKITGAAFEVLPSAFHPRKSAANNNNKQTGNEGREPQFNAPCSFLYPTYEGYTITANKPDGSVVNVTKHVSGINGQKRETNAKRETNEKSPKLSSAWPNLRHDRPNLRPPQPTITM